MTRNSAPEMTYVGEHFTYLLSPTRRGARLARLLAERQLHEWGAPSAAALHIVAELASNAVLHGRVPGRDFRLTLRLRPDRTLRIEVTDARGDRVPALQESAPGENGRGLLIVSAYADHWGVHLTPPTKTVWAELAPNH